MVSKVGFNVELTEEQDRKSAEYFCGICKNVVNEASICCSKKQHVFCRCCLTQYIEKNKSDDTQTFACPLECEEQFEESQITGNEILDRLVKKLSCKCRHCDWSGTIQDYIKNEHESTCQSKSVQCTYKSVGCQFLGCSESMKSHTEASLEAHMLLLFSEYVQLRKFSNFLLFLVLMLFSGVLFCLYNMMMMY